MLFALQKPLIRFTLDPLFEDYGIPLAVMGVFVVFMALILVVVFITLLPTVTAYFSAKPAEQPADFAVEQELSEETLVVIAAAVAAMMPAEHRIIQIRGLTPAELGWSLEGRMQHHQSHRIHQRNRR